DYIPGEPSLWESEANRQRTIDLWRTIAARYVTEEWIGGYDLINETAWDLGSGNAPLRDLMVRVTNAIREVDTNHIVFIEGNWYATDFSGLTPPWDDNMVYSFHKYWNSNDFSSISGYLSLRNTHNVPLWLGESGENSNHWFAECIALMEANNIGWAWWPHKKIESIAGPLSSRKYPGYDYLLQYWQGQVTRPTESYAVDALNGQAENLKIEKCVYQHDVVDAVIRMPSDTRRAPYASNRIPGVVFATNYDMGLNAVAYRDVEFQNTGNSSYNSGWSFRNDGVDIEKCSDLLSNGFNVGWTAASEFLTYTVEVPTAGLYHLGLRVSAGQAGGSVLLRMDGAVMGGVLSIPATGGWQSWVTVNAGQHTFAAGTHDFRVDIVSAGFNFASAVFSLVTAAVDPAGQTPPAFSLDQNYPNPFNPSTTIRFSIPEQRHTTLKLFDLLGNEVAMPVNGRLEAGAHTVQFDARHLASGVYVCRLTSGTLTQSRKMALIR
ncbi:MAG: Endoglucanase, partial [Bacteroidetes bacterium]|nr:Endoglucanase [Bacteroidota bacterium]